MPPHGSGTMMEDTGMAYEEYSFNPDQGMQLPAQGIVLDACHNLTGDLMATASSQVVQSREAGCIQVGVGPCTAVCWLCSILQNHLGNCSQRSGPVAESLCVYPQVWGSDQDSWRLLHTDQVSVACTKQSLLMSVMRLHVASRDEAMLANSGCHMPIQPMLDVAAVTPVCLYLLLQVQGRPTQLAWAHPQHGQLLAVGTSSGQVHIIQGPLPGSQSSSIQPGQHGQAHQQEQQQSAGWCSIAQLQCGKGPIR